MMAYGELGNRLSFYNISTQSTGIYDILVKAKSLKGESFLMIIGLFVGIIIGYARHIRCQNWLAGKFDYIGSFGRGFVFVLEINREDIEEFETE